MGEKKRKTLIDFEKEESLVAEGLEVTNNLDSTQILSQSQVNIEDLNELPSSLVLLVGPIASVGKRWSLSQEQMIIGRASISHVLIEDMSVSKSHAKLIIEDGKTYIQDLDSTNNTFVNGNQLNSLEKVELHNSDQIKVGNVILKFLEQGSIENVSASKAFSRMVIDPLTKTYNKGALMSQAEEEFKKSQHLGMELSLIIFDLDYFKQINDTYGHSTGDYILKEMCHLISSKVIRSNDFLARFGGEEFCILLLGSNLEQAMKKAEKIRILIENHEFKFNKQIIPVTISLGVAVKKPSDKKWRTVFERADDALYKAKELGRNKVQS